VVRGILRARNFQLPAHGPHCTFFDFAVAWYGRHFAGGRIHPKRVRPTFTEETASVGEQMALEIEQLHEATRRSGSRRTSLDARARASSR
jgi:hypothetical protein